MQEHWLLWATVVALNKSGASNTLQQDVKLIKEQQYKQRQELSNQADWINKLKDTLKMK